MNNTTSSRGDKKKTYAKIVTQEETTVMSKITTNAGDKTPKKENEKATPTWENI